jgi:hypothetical protein
VGSVRDVWVVLGLPGTNSREWLMILDDEHHVLSFLVASGKLLLHKRR